MYIPASDSRVRLTTHTRDQKMAVISLLILLAVMGYLIYAAVKADDNSLTKEERDQIRNALEKRSRRKKKK